MPAAKSPADARTCGDGRSEMRVLLTKNGSRVDVELMVGPAMQPAAAEERDAPAATGVMATGGWR